MAPTNDKTPIRLLSLFSGCGGLDLGFEGDFETRRESVNLAVHGDWQLAQGAGENWVRLEKTKFKTVFANDIRPGAKKAWARYFGKKGADESVYHTESIVNLVKLHAESAASVFPKGIDIVTGGFPCQDFSAAGKRKGFESHKSHSGELIETNAPNIENRGMLYMWMREVIGIVQPKIFIAENVKGLTNLADAKNIIENDFRSISSGGYLVVNARVLHAANYGVPQSRERVIFIGFKKNALKEKAAAALSLDTIPEEYDPYPPATHSFNVSGENLLPPVTLSAALDGLEEPELSRDPSQQKYSMAKYFGKKVQGQSEVNMGGIGPTIRAEHHGNIEFRRLSREHDGKNATELQAGLEERRLSVRECARIQTFPDDYEFVIPASGTEKGVAASEAYKLIGNAVPPLLGYHLAKRIEKNWNLYFKGGK